METMVLEKNETLQSVTHPSKWKVIFWNDDITPMGFVIHVLKEIFRYEESDAFDLMMKIHNTGSGVVGEYIKSVAESKMMVTKQISEKAGYQLKVTIERAIDEQP